MHRRRFLTHTAATLATALAARAASPPPNSSGLIDTNVSLSDWPTRHAWAGDASQLVAKLRQHNVKTAWAANFDAALHTDIAGSNERLSAACARQGSGILQPVGTVNPTFPDWHEDLRRCQEVHRMAALRLYPNYHGYQLDDPRFAQLLDAAAKRSLLVQIALSIEDDRSQNPALQAAPVAVAPLPDVLAKIPSARVMLLNAFSRVIGGNNAMLRRLTEAGIAFEIATLELAAGIESTLKSVPGIRLCFGSHSPFYYFEAALLKLQESALTNEQLAAIRHGHAAAVLR